MNKVSFSKPADNLKRGARELTALDTILNTGQRIVESTARGNTRLNSDVAVVIELICKDTSIGIVAKRS
jgi:hypothetical protein